MTSVSSTVIPATDHNPAGHTFTRLPDEHTFTTYNGLAVVAYQRAAHALRRAGGTDGPMTAYLLDDAHAALGEVLAVNRTLAAELDRDQFFCNIRPYFKPHLVSGIE